MQCWSPNSVHISEWIIIYFAFDCFNFWNMFEHLVLRITCDLSCSFDNKQCSRGKSMTVPKLSKQSHKLTCRSRTAWKNKEGLDYFTSLLKEILCQCIFKSRQLIQSCMLRSLLWSCFVPVLGISLWEEKMVRLTLSKEEFSEQTALTHLTGTV